MSTGAKDKAGNWVRPEIRALKAYAVPDAGGLIKLDAMENPYSFPAAMRDEWLRVMQNVGINRYPDPGARALKQRLREALNIPPDMSVLLGNGSDELIQMIAMALAQPGRVVLAPVPTFVMYDMIATFTGMRFVGVPLAPDFTLDLPAMLAAIRTHRPAVIFLAYPNNPTGNLFDAAAMEQVIAATDGLVVVDEAYHAFAGESFMDRLGRYDNLVVMRTLSKQGLAGLRLGILAGDAAWLDEFDKVRLPYNINSLTQASAGFALEHVAELDRQAARIRADREELAQALAGLPGIRVWPSRANFILFRITAGDASAVFRRLLAAGVLIKNLDPGGGALRGCLRVTVGAPHENAAFLAALGAIMQNPAAAG
jgi:histidinol-phosphate aminotransferase